MTHELINRIFMPRFSNPILSVGDDSAQINLEINKKVAVTTDSHVVHPLFFSGGDIGRLAICGTVNDLAVMGAEPKYLTVGFILEEGLSISILEAVCDSMRVAAEEANVQIIAGDTKVVERGKADGLFITTSGVGIIPEGIDVSGSNALPGDCVILSGPIGDHGIAVLEARGELGFTSGVQSDVAPLNHLISDLLNVSPGIHTMRDPTRGGLATTLVEIAQQSNVCIKLYEEQIPIRQEVASVCEILGYDPLFIANEGKVVVIAPADQADTILNVMKQDHLGKEASIIGEIIPTPARRVIMKTTIGTTRVVDMLSGEMLPRIC
jgi:hydrogenase expression/formation protein HypE